MGNMGYSFVAVGLYYCSARDVFGHFAFGITDPIVDGGGRTWRLVSTDLVNWMAGTIRKAFEASAASDSDLSAAILKFYRVRDRLEQEYAAVEAAWAARSTQSKGGQHPPGGAGGGLGAAVAGGEGRGVAAAAVTSSTEVAA